jgi:hypothetical protein
MLPHALPHTAAALPLTAKLPKYHGRQGFLVILGDFIGFWES